MLASFSVSMRVTHKRYSMEGSAKKSGNFHHFPVNHQLPATAPPIMAMKAAFRTVSFRYLFWNVSLPLPSSTALAGPVACREECRPLRPSARPLPMPGKAPSAVANRAFPGGGTALSTAPSVAPVGTGHVSSATSPAAAAAAARTVAAAGVTGDNQGGRWGACCRLCGAAPAGPRGAAIAARAAARPGWRVAPAGIRGHVHCAWRAG
mmetsp:Transcript_36576/g.101509  ORF Transcript_36576/g.101509 Transcript_36576/m.101509 type:complete len:207 (+) Transcript_36576:517-1137(+)